MSDQKRAPRRRLSGEREEGSASASPPQQGGARPAYPSPPQQMAYSGQPGPQHGAYGLYQQGRPPHVSSMNPGEAGRQQQFPPGGAPPFGGIPSRPGDPRLAASAQQVTPDTRQLLHAGFMSPNKTVRRRSPSPPGTKETSSKRPRVARSGKSRYCVFAVFVYLFRPLG
jgi:hypothetical protein